MTKCIGWIFLLLAATNAMWGDDWPQWMGPHRDGVWREEGILERFPQGGPPVRWRVSIGGGYAGPAVAEGRVFVMDRQLAVGADVPADAFERGIIAGSERVLCLSETDGSLQWTYAYDCPYTVSYPAGPRATPTVDGDRVYTLGAEGDLACLDVRTGEVKWTKKFTEEFEVKTPMWGFAGHPLVDGDRLICLAGGPGSVAVAFDKHTGKELWRALTAREPGYCPPVIYEYGGLRQLILWHPEAVSGLDPATGEVYWSYPTDIRHGLTISMPRKWEDLLFLTSFYNGSLMLRVGEPEPELVWKSRKISEKDTSGLHSIMPTPTLMNDRIYGVCSYGQFRCLDLKTGERLWESFEPTTGKPTRWGNAFIIRQGDRFFLCNELGDLIIARLSEEGYVELDRTPLLEATGDATGRPVVWSHPAFANQSVYARNDEEILCVSMAEAEQ